MNLIYKKSNIKGFTLLETIIYVCILSLFIMILTSTFTSILDVQIESQSNSAIEQDNSFILSRLIYDLHRTQNINLPATFGQNNPSMQIAINGINYTYNLVNGNLMLTDNIGTDQLNSSETTISDLNFLKTGNPGGKNSITATYTVVSKTLRGGVHESKTFQSTISLR
jgi:hypothetical protein